MSHIKIMTDSTCDLPEKLLEENDISIVPLYVLFGDQAFRDGVDIRAEELYRMVDTHKTLPKTSAPSPGDFREAFRPYIDEGRDILYIALSSQISSTYQNAVIASREFPEGRIRVIDSQNLSIGIGLLVMKAVDCAREGMSLDEIGSFVSERVDKVRTRFVINTMDYLYKGGRCSALASFVGSFLSIKPVVTVREGKIILEEKVRGKMEKALSNMVENVLQDKDRMDESRVFVAHSMAEKEARHAKAELESKLRVEQVLLGDAGCVISSHCGPGTVGIYYIRREQHEF